MSGRQSALVGRDQELSALVGLLERARGEDGGLLLLRGEAGIGKTRLLQEAASRAKERGFAVAWGRAWELGGAPSYWPFIEALRVLLARPGGRTEGAAALTRLLPELGEPSAPKAAENREAFQLFDIVTSYLLAAAEREPLLLILDDLHVADPSSLALAEFLARKIRGSRVALLGSLRDVEARFNPELDAQLARLGRAGEVWLLGPLDVRCVAELVRASGCPGDGETVAMIHATSEGNPLFAEELLRLLAQRGKLAKSTVPAGVRAVIRERLALLSPATVALLQAAAVVGRDFELGVAAEVAGVTQRALADAAEEAEHAEIVSRISPTRFRFAHALFAETLSQDQPSAARSRLHQRAAEALRERHQDDPTPPLDEIAHHLLEAGPEHADAALSAAERAAEAASARLAFADAAVLYERAVGVLSLHQPADAFRRADLLVRAGEAWSRAMNRERARASVLMAQELSLGLSDGVLLARAALALGAEVSTGRVDAEVIRALELSLRYLPEADDAWRAQVTARLASAQQPALDPQGPVALARSAIAMGRRVGDRQVLLRVLHSAMGALVDYAPAAERAALNREVAALADEFGDRPRGLRARMRLVFDCADLTDVPAFELALAEYEALAAEVRQPRYESVALMFRSMRANWEGRFADADRLEEEAFRLVDAEGLESFAPIRDFGRGLVRGDPVVLRAAIARIRKLYPGELSLNQWMHLREDVELGRLADAAARLEGIEASGFSQLFDIHALDLAGGVAWALRHAGLARAVYDELLPYSGRPMLVTAIGFSLHGSADHVLMQLAAVLGQRAEFERHGRLALELCQRLGFLPHEARVRRDYGIALRELFGPGTDDEAARSLALAERIFTRLGMVAVAEGVRDELALLRPLAPPAQARAEAPPPSPAPGERPKLAVSLELEGEYWTLTGLGQVCRIRDNRGLKMLAQLMENPGRELHVLDLAGALEPVDGGDSGEVIDREARLSYERRLRELTAELEEAAAFNDLGRRERLETEEDALRAELSRATGLGGRERRGAQVVERARVNVRRRLALALRRIEESSEALGRHFAASIRTGVYCVYTPS